MSTHEAEHCYESLREVPCALTVISMIPVQPRIGSCAHSLTCLLGCPDACLGNRRIRARPLVDTLYARIFVNPQYAQRSVSSTLLILLPSFRRRGPIPRLPITTPREQVNAKLDTRARFLLYSYLLCLSARNPHRRRKCISSNVCVHHVMGWRPVQTCALQILSSCCFSGLEAWFTVSSGWATHC